MSRIFLSHSSSDNAYAIVLRNWLAAEGWEDVFLDLDPRRGIAAGERWEMALNQAADRCEVVLFLVSRSWLGSQWCRKELNLAHRLNKRIFGVLIEDIGLDEIPEALASEWQLVRLGSGRDHISFSARLPVSHEEVHVTLSEEGLHRLKHGLEHAGLDPKFFAWPPSNDPMRSPYRGLLPFEADDAGIFFGREAPTVQVVDTLRGQREAAPPRLFVILGASGSGKSSFMRAGVLPRLARDETNFFPLPIIRPERSVLFGETGLLNSVMTACALTGLSISRAELRSAIMGGSSELKPYLDKLAEKARPNVIKSETGSRKPAIVVAVDQGEELFRSEGKEDSLQFLTLLRELLEQDNPPIIGVFTIRSDNYERLQMSNTLEGIHQTTFSLPPMPRGAYVDVIKGPARRLEGTSREFRIEEALVEAILSDIESGGAKDSLPLLAFTLDRLYQEYFATGDLKLSHYVDLGRVKGSIEAAVERAFSQADAIPAIPNDRDARISLLRRGLIPWLAGLDPDTGEPRRRVARISEIPAESRPLMDLLVEQRLLATDVSRETGDVTIEPAHESLLRQWGLLQGWLEDDFEDLSVAEGAKRAARDWEANARDEEWLAHTGGRLETAEKIADRRDFTEFFDSSDRAYIAAARNAENHRALKEAQRKNRELDAARRLARRTTVGLLVSILLACGACFAGFIAYQHKQEAEQSTEIAQQAEVRAKEEAARAGKAEGRAKAERDVAQVTQSQLLSDVATKLLDDGRGDTTAAALIALEALPDEAPGIDGNSTYSRKYVPEAERALYDAIYSRREVAVLPHDDGAVLEAKFNPDGNRTITLTKSGVVRVWDSNSGDLVARLDTDGDAVSRFVLSPDGSRLATATYRGSVYLWDPSSGVLISELKGHRRNVRAIVFNPNGELLVSASNDSSVRIWNATDGKRVAHIDDHEGPVTVAKFRPDGKRLITGASDGTVRTWNTETFELETILDVLRFSKDAEIESLDYSPDGTRIVVKTDYWAPLIWDGQKFEALATLRGHCLTWNDEGGCRVYPPVFSPDGSQIVTYSKDYTARIWNGRTGGHEAVLSDPDRGFVSDIAISSDSKRILTASRTGIARLWSAADGSQVAILRGHEDSIYDAEFSPDGNLILTVSRDATARLWDGKTGITKALLKHEDSVVSGSFSADGNRIVTASHDGTARIWEIDPSMFVSYSPGRPLSLDAQDSARLGISRHAAIELHDQKLLSKTVRTPDGLVTLKVVGNVNALEEIQIFKKGDTRGSVQIDPHCYIGPGYGEGGCQISIHAVSQDGMLALTSGTEGNARVWTLREPISSIALEGTSDSWNSADFSPDGRRVATSSRNIIRIWDVASGKLVARAKARDKFSSLQFSTDGQWVFGRIDKSIEAGVLLRVFPTTQSIVEFAKKRFPRCLTPGERTRYKLPLIPPRWYITGTGRESELDVKQWEPCWPYGGLSWRSWLNATTSTRSNPTPSVIKKIVSRNLRAAESETESGNIKRAIEIYSDALAQANYPGGLTLRGSILARRGTAYDLFKRPIKRDDDFLRAHELGEDLVWYFLSLAKHHYWSDQTKAEKGFDAAIRWAEVSKYSPAAMAQLYFTRGKYFNDQKIKEKRNADFAEAVRLSSTFVREIASYFLNSAEDDLRRGGRYKPALDEALASYDNALKWASMTPSMLAPEIAAAKMGRQMVMAAKGVEALDAGDVRLVRFKAIIAHEAQKYQKALQLFERAVALNPSDKKRLARRVADARYGIAWHAFLDFYLEGRRPKNFADLLQHAEAAVDFSPDNTRYRYTRGQMYLAVGRYDAAIADFNKEIDRGTERHIVYYLPRGIAQEKKGNIRAAVRDYANAVQSFDGLSKSLQEDQLYLMMRRDAEARIEVLRQRVSDQSLQTDIEFAMAELSFQRGKRLQEKNAYKRAISAYTKAISLDPKLETRVSGDLARAHNEVAWSTFVKAVLQKESAGSLKVALKHADIAVALAPDSKKLLDTRGQILFRLKKFDQALNDLDKAIQLGMHHADTYFVRARINEHKGNDQAAVRDYANAVQSFGGLSNRFQQDRLYLNIRRDAEARIDMLGQRISDPSLLANVWLGLAEHYFQRGKRLQEKNANKRAISAYTKAISLDPKLETRVSGDLARAHNRVAWSTFENAVLQKESAGSLKVALKHADIALALAPDSKDLLDTRGQILFRLKKFDQALIDLDKAIKLGLHYAGTYFARARINDHKGNDQAAIADYEATVNFGAGGDAYAKSILLEAKRRLATLRAKARDQRETTTAK